MSELKEYKVTNERGFETTLLLSDDDAKARGLSGGKKRAEGEHVMPDLNSDTAEAQQAREDAVEQAQKQTAKQEKALSTPNKGGTAQANKSA